MARPDDLEERRHQRRAQTERTAREGSDVEVSGWGAKFRASNVGLQELLILVMVALLSYLAVMSYTHRDEIRQARQESARALTDVARTQHFFACIISIPMEQRRMEMERGRFCAELSHWAVPEGKEKR